MGSAKSSWKSTCGAARPVFRVPGLGAAQTHAEQIRVAALAFLDTDVFNVSAESCVSFLDPIIDGWDIDVKTLGMEVALNRRLAPGSLKRFEFSEEQNGQVDTDTEPGLEEFLWGKSLS